MKQDTYPSINKNSFACPFCGAFTTQYWYTAYAKSLTDNALPFIPKGEPDDIKESGSEIQYFWRESVLQYSSGKLFFSDKAEYNHVLDAGNIHFSQCYSCKDIAVWVHDKLVFPPTLTGPNPNADIPDDIKVHYEEARAILDLSPRGAAALLRLCIEKLCAYLEPGKDLYKAIGVLRTKGLKQRVVDALDIVRVIGNEAVHPGTIDLNDDRETAEALFGLVNIITEEMISEDKHINTLYSKLPDGKRKQIEQRDKV